MPIHTTSYVVTMAIRMECVYMSRQQMTPTVGKGPLAEIRNYLQHNAITIIENLMYIASMQEV